MVRPWWIVLPAFALGGLAILVAALRLAVGIAGSAGPFPGEKQTHRKHRGVVLILFAVLAVLPAYADALAWLDAETVGSWAAIAIVQALLFAIALAVVIAGCFLSRRVLRYVLWDVLHRRLWGTIRAARGVDLQRDVFNGNLPSPMSAVRQSARSG